MTPQNLAHSVRLVTHGVTVFASHVLRIVLAAIMMQKFRNLFVKTAKSKILLYHSQYGLDEG